ncbi:hypothetical protein L7F22_023557 [Adiantum nelumboides]|nr:hypothetical protein [Adiantum nelumboides]
MAGERATSSQPFSTQRISSLKNLAPQIEGPTEQPLATKKSQKSGEASKRKRSGTLEVIHTEQPQKRQKKDVLSTSLQLVVVNPNTSMVVEANENKVLASIETKKTYYPFGFESNFSIDVMKCFPAPSHYVYRMLNKDWVKILTHDLIKDTKFQEILAIVMPIDEKLQHPLQTFTKDQISSATYWIISGQHSIVAAKHLQKSNLDKDFVETTEYTLHKGFVKNDLHLLLCKDEIWSNWELIMDTYSQGGLPNTKGEILAPTIAEQKSRIPTFRRGKIQQAPGTVVLGPTLFRCIAGLESEEVNINEEEEAHKEISGASKQNEEVEQEMKTCNEESCGASSDEDLQKQSTLHKDKDRDEEEASNVNQDNKEIGTSIDKINKDDEDIEDSSKIGSTHTGIIGTKVDCETKDYMDGDEHVKINNAFPNTLMVIEKLVLHPTPQLVPKGVDDMTKHLETTSSPNKEEELKELEDETKSKEINKVLEIGSCILEDVLDAGKSEQTAEVADIENKNDGDEMILEGDMQVEEQVFTRGEKEKGGNEFDVGSNVATTHPHLEELQPHSSTQKSDTCQRKFDDGFNGQKRYATKLFKSPIVDRVEADSRDCWNMIQPSQLNTLFTIDGMKFEIKTSTIPNAGYGLFAHDNIRESQFLMYYIGIKLDYDSWKTMCAKNPRVKMYSIVEDPNVDKDEDLLYVYGDVNMGNVAGYINSSIYCRHRENVEYQLYPGISPWKTFKQDLVDSKAFGYIGIHATRNINIGEELLCYYNF